MMHSYQIGDAENDIKSLTEYTSFSDMLESDDMDEKTKSKKQFYDY